MKDKVLLLILVFASALVACDSGPRSPAGFRLPQGDVKQGKAVFLEMECYRCHWVAGVGDLPSPTVDPPVSVVLGGRVFEVRTDGYLVTSIINPSHRLTRKFRGPALTTESGESRMLDYNEVMTVHQLTDLVAFLQSTYQHMPPPRQIR
jgi:hypothetical protein